jgi:hypothetical protein
MRYFEVRFSAMALLQHILRKNNLLFLCFWLLVAAVYAPAYNAGIYSDFKDAIYLYHQQSFTEFLNRDGLSIKSLYQVTQFVLYVFISLFGTNAILWTVLSISLHALNGLIICRFFERLFTKFNLPDAQLISVVGTVFFLLNPVQAEVVIWKACLHYMLALLQMFAIFHWTLSYSETGKAKYPLSIALLYAVSTFTIELFYLTPVFVTGILLAMLRGGVLAKDVFKAAMLKIAAPLFALLGLHRVLYFIVFGKWTPHYDIDFAAAFNYTDVIAKLNKYLLHIFGMEYLLPDITRRDLYNYTESIVGLILLSAVLAALFAIIFTRLTKLKAWAQLSLLLAIMALFSFMLVVPLWFSDSGYLYNDRYYHLPSVFLFFMAAILLFRIRIEGLRYALVTMYFMACVAGTFYISMIAGKATNIYYALIDNYKWRSASRVLLLNLPNNYEGIRQMPAESDGNFKRHLAVFTADSSQSRIYDVSSYNMRQERDGAHVKVIDSMNLRVTLNQWGCWWWYGSLGAKSYENELYKVNMTDQGHEYFLTLKSKPQGLVILYQQGENWKQVNMADTANEQW